MNLVKTMRTTRGILNEGRQGMSRLHRRRLMIGRRKEDTLEEQEIGSIDEEFGILKELCCCGARYAMESSPTKTLPLSIHFDA